MELYNAECLEKLKELMPKSVDCVILDLPYGTTDCEWDTKIDIVKLWEQLLRVGKDNTPYFFFGDMKLGVEIITANPKMFKYDLVWDKKYASNPLLARKRIRASHENIFVFYKKQPVFEVDKNHTIHKEQRHPVDAAYEGTLGGISLLSHNNLHEPRLPLSVMDFPKVLGKARKHATEKPVPLLEHLIKYYTEDNAVVLDPTMGSGTTGKACQNLGRRFIGIEMNKEIYDTAVERLGYSE